MKTEDQLKSGFHPEDLWYSKDILDHMEKYRSLQAELFHNNPTLIFRKGPFRFKLKCFANVIQLADARNLFEFAKRVGVSALEIVCNSFANESLEFLSQNGRLLQHVGNTITINLAKNTDDLFGAIEGKRRNQIRKAQKDGIRVVNEFSQDLFDQWWQIYSSTVKRGGFVPYPRGLVNALLSDGEAKLFCAVMDEKVIAGSVIVCNNYPYWWLGASDRIFSKHNAPSLIQWEALEYYKKERYPLYDMGGFDPMKKEDGPEQFKLSFGGNVREYLHLNVVIKPLRFKLVSVAKNIYYSTMKRETF